jgi:type IV secretory pathway TraG/TraD family ATPase VirD4
MKMTGAPLYDPRKYIDLKRGVFIGLNEKRKPLYVSWKQFRSTHFQIPGASGYGKGITLGLLSYQSILAGETAIMFDPKLDEFLLAVYAKAAQENGLPLHVLNLRQGQPAQFNPIAGVTGPELEEMLIGSMELFDSGSDADFHRGNDRDAAEAVARLAEENNVWSLPELLVLASKSKAITEREGFWRKFRHLAGLSAVQTDADLDLGGIFDRGEPLYIIGTTVRDPKVTMLQKLVLVRLIQLIEKRPKEKRRPVMLTLDEVRHQISNISLTALGTLRSANCHVAIAHQSFGDLFENQALSPDAVRGAVIDNTTLKIVYHLKDAELA